MKRWAKIKKDGGGTLRRDCCDFAERSIRAHHRLQGSRIYYPHSHFPTQRLDWALLRN